MEILIVGIMLVALMAYVSTRIKRSAREAFEVEVFENKEFTLTKPEGFIIPYNQNSSYAVEIYSKDFGDDEAKKFNQCQALISSENNFKKNSTSKTQKTDEGVVMQVWTKILRNKQLNKNYKLEITVLDDYKEQYLDKMNTMLESFKIK